jgi:hypothetical protein
MNYIKITAAAYDALVATYPSAVEGVEKASDGDFLVYLRRPQLQMLNAFQRSGESYSEAIIRACQERFKLAGVS